MTPAANRGIADYRKTPLSRDTHAYSKPLGTAVSTREGLLW
jgi:hypothetical protein